MDCLTNYAPMNCQYSRPLCISLLVLLVSCGRSSDKKDPLLDEAARYHNEATRIQAIVEPQIEQADSLKTTLAAGSGSNAQATATTLDSLKKAFAEWEENVVEVPGMPHNHSHEHGKHEHADATLKDLPADQMRDLQREMLNNIKQIQARLDAVTKPRP